MKPGILVAGICGRMGRKVAELVQDDPELSLLYGIEKFEHPCAESVISVAGKEVHVSRGFTDELPQAELVVDFTSPAGALEAASFCVQRSMALVSGTTGLSEKDIAALREASEKIPLLLSPNMSVGVTVVARALPLIVQSLGPDSEIEIIEKHHRAKKDSPSGTALRLAQVIASSEGTRRFEVQYGRNRELPRANPDELVIHSVRAGDIVGEHTIVLAGKGERIEISHIAESRECFAHGAIAAIKFLVGKWAGWYTMEDIVQPPPQW